MEPISEPGGLTHPKLQEFAMIAAWIATLAETVDDLEDLLIELPRQEPLMPNVRTPWPWACDTMAVALAVVKTHRTEAVHALEGLVTTWLGEDREHGPVLQRTLLAPWQESPGFWSGTPRRGSAPSPPSRREPTPSAGPSIALPGTKVVVLTSHRGVARGCLTARVRARLPAPQSRVTEPHWRGQP
jgi:hypothetical protein